MPMVSQCRLFRFQFLVLGAHPLSSLAVAGQLAFNIHTCNSGFYAHIDKFAFVTRPALWCFSCRLCGSLGCRCRGRCRCRRGLSSASGSQNGNEGKGRHDSHVKLQFRFRNREFSCPSVSMSLQDGTLPFCLCFVIFPCTTGGCGLC